MDNLSKNLYIMYMFEYFSFVFNIITGLIKSEWCNSKSFVKL
jgi:hypothetical protein